VKFYHSKINFKLPRGGAEIGWHQDWPVFPHTNSNLVALSLPLVLRQRLLAHDPRHPPAGAAQPLGERSIHAELQHKHDG